MLWIVTEIIIDRANERVTNWGVFSSREEAYKVAERINDRSNDEQVVDVTRVELNDFRANDFFFKIPNAE